MEFENNLMKILWMNRLLLQPWEFEMVESEVMMMKLEMDGRLMFVMESMTM